MANTTVPADTRIVRAAIHPAIGVARVGNSAQEFFLGPQVTEPPPKPLGFYRDAEGALKREAAQFRIYGYNAAGEAVAELTADSAEISWQVHVANRKAQWYQWQIAMDIPEAAKTVLPLRNAKVKLRDILSIDAGAQSISGRDAAPVLLAGQFTGVPVKLGELRTDAQGRLVFLGGHGVSASPTDAPIFIPSDDNSFINADDWYDDTCDGPVSATVNIDGREIPVESAWVLTAPPNYAPQVKAERTLYDLLYDLYVQNGWLAAADTVSFTQDVYPILQRLSGLQWVNEGFATAFGHNGRYNFENPAFIAQLSRKPASPKQYDPHAELRRQIFNSFRPPSPPDANQLPWPWIYGDAMTVPAGQSPRQNSTISPVQSNILLQWVNGNFVADWNPGELPPADIDELPLAAQPAMLDRAALEFCLADAFHPGCETTWPMRHLTMYRAPFRIRERPPGTPEPNYGATLDQTQALAVNGPLHAQGPGDITRWMGLPWQADTAYCRAGYDDSYDPFQPTFWPARVPNQVLTTRNYDIVIDPAQPRERRIEAFGNRTDWTKPLHGTTAEQMEQMIRVFGSMGLLEVRTGVIGDADFPAVMMVAAFGPDVAPSDAQTPLLSEGVPGPAETLRDAARLPRSANFESRDEARKAPLPVRYKRD
jgi:L-Lysine epsilon oxidase N-terminal/L-lysine epsilon oxidase C-terminal domain